MVNSPTNAVHVISQTTTPSVIHGRMSLALQQEKQENAKLKEQKEEQEEAHSRDINALEGMLRPLADENKRLTQALQDAQAQSQPLKRCNLDDSIISIHTASTEPAKEPEIERSPQLDNFYSPKVAAHMREIQMRLDKVRA